MPDLFDRLLLRRPTPPDDRNLAFRRIDGNPNANVIYFLPWNTPLRAARQVGFVPLDYLACYELPPAIVSSDPGLCVQAMHALVADAEQLLRERGAVSWETLVVGLSAGTFPATFLANRVGARLCSVASVDRADLAVWHSPATRIIKGRAEVNGIQLSDYVAALNGCHPAQNLAGLGPGSAFVMGRRDPYIPPSCNAGLLHAIERYAVQPQIIQLNTGHFRTLQVSARYQRALMAGTRSPGLDLQRLVSDYRSGAFAEMPSSPLYA